MPATPCGLGRISRPETCHQKRNYQEPTREHGNLPDRCVFDLSDCRARRARCTVRRGGTPPHPRNQGVHPPSVTLRYRCLDGTLEVACEPASSLGPVRCGTCLSPKGFLAASPGRADHGQPRRRPSAFTLSTAPNSVVEPPSPPFDLTSPRCSAAPRTISRRAGRSQCAQPGQLRLAQSRVRHRELLRSQRHGRARDATGRPFPFFTGQGR